MDTFTLTIVDEDEVILADTVTAPMCTSCGAIAAPDGTCLEIGACERADRAATRGATGPAAKFRAWTARGTVD
jgi:hypothetical protein